MSKQKAQPSDNPARLSGQTATRKMPGARFTTLSELLEALQILKVRHGGQLLVVIRTRNVKGEVIFGEANAGALEIVRTALGLRPREGLDGEPLLVVCVGG